ncbi:hypothetical protein SAMD00019534_073840, partial [Acytostelium subglobosum LB1]|uniref:hypothetical protein n=1 Tax=Acytostelium subglobosum LB1 TaxID=1410327 RepID=UPI00064519BB
IYTVKYFFVLDSKGDRIIAKYYSNDFDGVNKQKAFERSVFDKTAKINGEITMLDNFIVVYRQYTNVIIYFVGDKDQNEIALLNVLNTFTETLHNLLDSNNINKQTILEGINLTLLALDEIIDDGILLENDPSIIANRVGIRVGGDADDLDQNISNVLASAKEQLANFLK